MLLGLEQVYTFDAGPDGVGGAGGRSAIPGKLIGEKAGDHELIEKEDCGIGLAGGVRGGTLDLIDLTVGIPSANGTSFLRTLVRGLNLNLAPGQSLLIMGPSGI